MATTFTLAPIPKWVLINNQGTVAGGAKLYTYSSLNFQSPKVVYADIGGTIPYSNPIIFDLNGTQGPFFWAFDSANPNDLYYLEAFDSDGNLLFTINNYGPGSGGGGGNTTTYLPLQNYIANNQFIDHIPDNAGPLPTQLIVAPSNHKGFTPSLINPISSTFGVVGPDIQFLKNNTNATDNLTFPLFPLASAPLTGDVTPVEYVRYQCTNAGLGGEVFKSFQFPITQKVKNLAGKPMTFRIWAAVASGTDTITAATIQYFGSGTATSATFRQVLGTPMALTTTWKLFTTNFTVPSVAGKTIGTVNSQTDDDALYIHLEMPLSATCDILFIKPALYLGTISPTQEFDDYDEIYSVTQTARTGDIKTSFWTTPPPGGWIPMDDKSIGNVLSGATSRANKDTFQLYKTLWDAVADAWAPVSTGRGPSALADFLANKTLTLPRSLGRALAGAGVAAPPQTTAHALGEWIGSEVELLGAANMPERVPVGSSNAFSTQEVVVTGAGGTFVPGGALTWAPGAANAFSIIQPSTYLNVFIKL